MRQFGLAALCAAGLLVSAGAASADTFVLTNSTHPNCGVAGNPPEICDLYAGNGFVTLNADGSTTLVGTDSSNATTGTAAAILEGQRPFNLTTYLAIADQDKTLVYSYKYLDLDTVGSCFDLPSQVLNGQNIATLCSGNILSTDGTNAPEFGSVTFNLNGGDSYGFSIFTDSSEGPGLLTFSLTSQVDGGSGGGGAVPEPSAWALMMLGFGVVGAALRHPRHRSISSERAA